MFWLTSPGHVGAEAGDDDGGTDELSGRVWVAQGQVCLPLRLQKNTQTASNHIVNTPLN